MHYTRVLDSLVVGITVSNTDTKYYWLLATGSCHCRMLCRWPHVGVWVIVDNAGGGGGGRIAPCCRHRRCATLTYCIIVLLPLTRRTGGKHPGCSVSTCGHGTAWRFRLLI